MKLKQAIPILIGAVVVIVLFIMGTKAIGIHDIWVSFFMLLYWANLKSMDRKEILNTIGGTAFGITMPLIGLLLGQIPFIGGVVYTLLLISAILFLIMGKLRVVINEIAFFVLTVLGITSMTQNMVQFIGYYQALVAGAVLIGIISVAIGIIENKKEGKDLKNEREVI